jgi:hypothetical protein
MSEPVLYLVDRDEFTRTLHMTACIPGCALPWDHWYDYADAIMATSMVPVERCEHGHIDEHPYTTNGEVWAVTIPSENIATCPGAGIGDNDET